MNRTRRLAVLVLVFAFLAAAPSVWAAATVTFTADDQGTFPNTLQFDAKEKRLTVDLSALPKDATVFRAELILNDLPRFERAPLQPTRVYPEGRPDRPLAFVPPRFRGLDALQAVREALHAAQPLRLRVEVTLAGVQRLEVSCLEARPRRRDLPRVSALRVAHRKGQSFLTFTEPPLEPLPDFKTGRDVRAFRDALASKHPAATFRIWRGPEPVTDKTVARAALVGECGFLTAWNDAYHQDKTDDQPPLRYRVDDLGEPVPWGTGIYAHNPSHQGRAHYAVTVAVAGEEDFAALGPGNATPDPVDEGVGPGEPVLQWIEQPEEWHYRKGPLTRLIYTRWESWPRSSVPGTPIDYLVAMGDEPLPDKPPAEAREHAWRVEPAPVGLHLHCWGGSLNGGYGWWYNAHRGAVLIASNQVPYDWWTGYHERRGSARTFGDGRVLPFSMTRTFAFLDWAATQWRDAPESVRKHWRKLDLTRVFSAGNSMGGAGAPMFAIRFPDRVAWCNAWVGVHVPELTPQFRDSYAHAYGPRDPAITMDDGKTSPWDWFSDVWWLRSHVKADTGFIIASNGKDDGGIGWPQACEFARALQDTRRPHLFNWDLAGHGTRTLVGSNFDLDLCTDQSLPAFTRCTLDDRLGTGRLRPKDEVDAERKRLKDEAEKAGRKTDDIRVNPTDGDPKGALNAHLAWETGSVVDAPAEWAMTVILEPAAPKDSCNVDLTPRRLQRFRTASGRTFAYTVTDLASSKVLKEGRAVADEFDLLTLPRIPLVKGNNRVRIVPAN